MFRPTALHLLPFCLALTVSPLLVSCKQTGVKIPKWKWNRKAQTADPATPTTASGSTAAVAPSPAEAAFLAKCGELAATGPTIAGRDGWNFSSTELQRLLQLQDPNAASIGAATTAIAEYQSLLRRQGVDLVVVPLPPKSIVYPDRLSKDLKVKVRRNKPVRLDASLQTIYAQLRQRGVTVLDPTDLLLENRESKKGGPAYPKTAGVWSPGGAALVAGWLGKEWSKAAWANQPGPDGPLITEATTLSYSGPLMAGPALTETLPIRNVGRASGGKMRSVTFAQGGNALGLMGDPALLAWREANNPPGSANAFGSLADQLAFELQTTPDLYPGKSEGRNSPRSRILREATNGRNPLARTKVLVWVIPATDFALPDWKRIPLKLDFSSSQPPVMLAPPVELIPDSGSPRIAPPPRSSAPPANAEPGEPELPR